MAQTKARPPTFVLFSSRADQMPEHYRRYLINSLRESFDLPGVPLRITIKSGRNPYAEEGGSAERSRTAYKPKRSSGLARSNAKHEGAAAAKPAAKPKKPRVAKGVSKGVGLKKAAKAKALRSGRSPSRPPRRRS
jgi:GTP-binding protein